MKNGSVNSIPVEVKKLRELNTLKRRGKKKIDLHVSCLTIGKIIACSYDIKKFMTGLLRRTIISPSNSTKSS